jgi:hypothetical protein
MLEHSGGTSGERRSVDLNGLIEEALNLAYHGGRAQDASFNITLERDYAEAMVGERQGCTSCARLATTAGEGSIPSAAPAAHHRRR